MMRFPHDVGAVTTAQIISKVPKASDFLPSAALGILGGGQALVDIARPLRDVMPLDIPTELLADHPGQIVVGIKDRRLAQNSACLLERLVGCLGYDGRWEEGEE
jgi:hypothetical protein